MVLRRTSWLIASLLVVLAALAAVSAAPPNLARTLEAQRRLAAERPGDAGVLNDLGNLLMLVPEPAEAESAYRRALELDPDKVSALYNLGLLLQQRGELRDAMKLYEHAADLDPRHAWVQYQMGSIHETWRQRSKAVDAYARAFALDPQLAFAEVNPQIVENKLVTESMLRAYRSDYAHLQAPKVYEDPSRIATLLVKPATAPEAADQAAAAQPKPNPAQPKPGQAAAPGNRVPAAAGAARPGQAPTVLRERDLDRNNPAGQALPPGAVRPTTGGMRQQPSRGLREWNRPEPIVQEVPTDEQPDVINDGGQPGQVITPPPGGVYYRPGIQSTGRLNLEVVPGRAAKLARVGRG
jgi:tetratricopeptide (TPR) repeat protein